MGENTVSCAGPMMIPQERQRMSTIGSGGASDPVTLVFQLDVSDGINSGTARLSVTIPDDKNDPPELLPITVDGIDELGTLSFYAEATDADGNDLSFGLAGDVPRGASIDPATGKFSWTPDQPQDGDYSFEVTVSDGDGGADSQQVHVTINDIEPRPVSARGQSDSVTLTLSEAVTSSGTGPNGFSILPADPPVSVESISGNGTVSLTLSLNGTISRGATLSYDPSSDNVADETGKALESFPDLSISFQSRSKSSSLPPAITIGSQGHPQVRGAAPDGPLQPVPASEPSAFPLVINQNGYALESQTSTVIPTNVTAGQPVAISVMMHDSTQISYFAVYLHRSGGQISHLQSDTQVIWDSGQVRMTDPSGLMHNATITLSEDPGDPSIKTATLTVSFSEGMGETNMVVRTWNADGQITEVRVFDALAVTPPGQAPVDPSLFWWIPSLFWWIPSLFWWIPSPLEGRTLLDATRWQYACGPGSSPNPYPMPSCRPRWGSTIRE